ncbi:hypothetical protein QAD02_008914 [Eretmocerus hayati]|uniref:Uncharacterized protein n=1 Tax=Eretmocerus hayati TaxID=131215 RepID=A0ACC2N869_9HYME|nr:hypothetical protein QAD02_008914 [Eretmocerus hayati]
MEKCLELDVKVPKLEAKEMFLSLEHIYKKDMSEMRVKSMERVWSERTAKEILELAEGGEKVYETDLGLKQMPKHSVKGAHAIQFLDELLDLLNGAVDTDRDKTNQRPITEGSGKII